MDPTRVCLFGHGYFGKAHARTLQGMGVPYMVVDTDPAKKEDVEKLGVQFVCANLTEALGCDTLDEQGNTAYFPTFYPNEEKIPADVLGCDAWDIVASPSSHARLALLGILLGKRVFVEKPATQTLEDLKVLVRHARGQIFEVDYIETVHPVVSAIRKRMQEEHIPFTFASHRRSKDVRKETGRGLGEGRRPRIVQEDLVHDISEILSFLPEEVGQTVSVKSAVLKPWSSLGPEFEDNPPDIDVEAEIVLSWAGCELASLYGSFAAPEVRAFVVGNLDKEIGFYGNTLTRAHIKPAAALLRGKSALEEVAKAIVTGQILRQEDQDRVLKDVGAESIQVGQEESLAIMLSGFLNAKGPEDLHVGAELAFRVESIANDIYEVAGFA